MKENLGLKAFVRRRMRDLGLSRHDVAAIVGTSHISVYYVESGRTKHLPFKKLAEWANALKVSYAEVQRFYTPRQHRAKAPLTPEGNTFRKARLAKSFSHRELARRVEANPALIYRIEKGERPFVSEEVLSKLNAELDLEISYLQSLSRTVRKPHVKHTLSGDPLGDFFRSPRIDRGLKQRDAAKLLRIDVSLLGDIERGEIKPHPKLLQRMEEFYERKVPPEIRN